MFNTGELSYFLGLEISKYKNQYLLNCTRFYMHRFSFGPRYQYRRDHTMKQLTFSTFLEVEKNHVFQGKCDFSQRKSEIVHFHQLDFLNFQSPKTHIQRDVAIKKIDLEMQIKTTKTTVHREIKNILLKTKKDMSKRLKKKTVEIVP